MALFIAFVVLGSFELLFLALYGHLPRPYYWLALGQISPPLIALGFVLYSPSRFSMFHGQPGGLLVSENDHRLGPGWFAFIPTSWILLSYYYVKLVEHRRCFVFGCMIGALLFMAAAAREVKLRTRGATANRIAGVLLSLAWGYATVLQLNCVLDSSAAKVEVTTVLDKRQDGRLCFLRIAPSEAQRTTATVCVPCSLSGSVGSGSRVSVVLRAGALGIKWYTVQRYGWKGGPVHLDPGTSPM